MQELGGKPYNHKGTDYGTHQKHLPVISVADAEVTAIKPYTDGDGAGNRVSTRAMIYGEWYYIMYFHLDTFADIKVGDKVEQGRILGTVGTTGHSTGIHLHIEVHKGYNFNKENAIDFAEILFKEE